MQAPSAVAPMAEGMATPSQLFNWMQMDSFPPILVDTRLAHHYAASHINRAVNITTRDVDIDHTALLELEMRSSVDHMTVFRRRTNKNYIVLYGTDAEDQRQVCEYLARLLVREDPLHKVVILHGGFKAFRRQYPFLCDKTPLRESHLSDRDLYPTDMWEGQVFVGSIRQAMRATHLKNLGITHIVNFMDTWDNAFPEDFTYCNCPLRDQDMYPQNGPNIKQYFSPVYLFIEMALREGGKVLLYCRYGVSVSVGGMLAYLMRAEAMTLQEAYEHCAQRRIGIAPKYGVWYHLAEFEFNLYGFSTLHRTIDIAKLFPGKPRIRFGGGLLNVFRCCGRNKSKTGGGVHNSFDT